MGVAKVIEIGFDENIRIISFCCFAQVTSDLEYNVSPVNVQVMGICIVSYGGARFLPEKEHQPETPTDQLVLTTPQGFILQGLI
ncbi:hypothetical protein CEXT_739591 [Caerostris extrusa]|uniref:Uncharacterized protein n=1 Tax=Caerostris extrusa TaxID=172846 RepID=A0AAV4VVX1_CAEEX|nr:hypothetical protein CEXT_739591 [Caerostris extrusa]